ncbi:thiamine-phosphate diphosphorylase [Enterovibrio norvegicus]|uniref:thiamine phosphate synthase n=1 Tax=Enterovibrio norvegicus TaxID=188144 RepID=UPI00031C291B|nr:thiamine phosphate synthase [Enterovibrio norvegicus]OEF51332.1 thiamine-phosphate diphosphorylase [Enterovibrio norvegicus]
MNTSNSISNPNPNPYRLYLVTDDNQDLDTLKRVVKDAVAGGVTMVQVREKSGDVRRFIARAAAVKAILAGTGVPLIINDRVDVALAVDADGVHLGQSDMPAEFARALIGENKLLGLSIETEQQLFDAESLPVDYLGLSAIFATPTKTNIKKEWGIDGLAHAVKQSAYPIVAIGGLNASNLDDVIATGASGIALVSAICHADSPKEAANALMQQLERNASEDHES